MVQRSEPYETYVAQRKRSVEGGGKKGVEMREKKRKKEKKKLKTKKREQIGKTSLLCDQSKAVKY
jgi:hypothetical protein